MFNLVFLLLAFHFISYCAVVGCIVVFHSDHTITNYLLLYISHAGAGQVDATNQGTGVIDKLGKEEAVKTMHSQENHVKELEATIMVLNGPES